MGADVSWDSRGLRDASHHPVDIAPVDGPSGDGPQNQRPAGALPTAGFEDAQDRDGERHGGGLVALADKVQDSMAAHGLGVVLDPYRRLGSAQGVDAEQVGECAVVDGDGLGDLQEPDQLEPVQALCA